MNNLKQLRAKRDLLQTKVALDLNLSQETISSYETGRVGLNDNMLIKFANYYDTSIDFILCRTKYDFPIDSIKPDTISEKDFQLLTKINKLSATDQLKVEAYIDGLNSK